MKAKKFRTKKAALESVAESQRQGWAAGIIGKGPWLVDATGYANSGTVRITYSLGIDGFFHEISRSEIAPSSECAK